MSITKAGTAAILRIMRYRNFVYATKKHSLRIAPLAVLFYSE